MLTLSHSEARDIVARAWRAVHGRAPTTRELLYTLAVASLETGYGRAGQFGRLAEQGLYNWGAEQTRAQDDGSGTLVCPAGTAPGGDTYQGQPVSVCFYVAQSDDEAAARIIRTLTVSFPTRARAILQAMARGSAADVAHAMKTSPAYYTADESDYARGLAAKVATIAREAGLVVGAGVKAWLGIGMLGALGVGVGLAGRWIWSRVK